jgi:hypothetical protein
MGSIADLRGPAPKVNRGKLSSHIVYSNICCALCPACARHLTRSGLTLGSTGSASVGFASFRAPVSYNVGRLTIQRAILA